MLFTVKKAFLIVKNAYPEQNGTITNNHSPPKKRLSTPQLKLVTPTLIKGANNPHP